MAEPAGVKIKGYKSAIKALQEIGVPTSEIKAAGSEAGELVAAEARQLVPVRSGALRNTIRVTKALNAVSVKAGNERKVPYANPIHWGWFKRNILPQPFFTKALGITRNEVYQTYYRNIDKLIAQNATKGTDE